MKLKTILRKALVNSTGYWIFKHKHIPIGCDLVTDLRDRIGLQLNTIFDVGANIGQTALVFNKDFPEAKIYSFEPVINTFKRLLRNIESSTNIQCFNLALSDTEGPVNIRIFNDVDSELNSLNENAMNNSDDFKIERIEVTTGDVFCFQNQIAEIDLLKLDTEGCEINVLDGFSSMIEKSKIKAIYCEAGLSPTNLRNTYLSDLLKFAFEKGFAFYAIYDIRNFNIEDGRHYGNVLFIQKEFVINQPEF